jgi:hypothetical protein
MNFMVRSLEDMALAGRTGVEVAEDMVAVVLRRKDGSVGDAAAVGAFK